METRMAPSSFKSRHRRSFSLTEKMKIIERLAKGQSATKIARDYNVNESTIRHMRKQEATIRLQANSMTSKVASESMRNRNMQMSKMEACLITWLDDLRAKRLQVWHSKVKTKALELYNLIAIREQLECAGFVASTGWYERFKRKHDLFELRLHEERTLPSEIEFKTTMRSAINEADITPRQIFCIETSLLNWKRLPGLKGKEKAMMLFACDASGNFFTQPVLHSIKTGSATNSAFVKLDISDFINQQDVRDWFYDSFVSQADAFLKSFSLPDRAIVLVANDPNHPSDLEHYSFDVATIPAVCNPTCLPTARGILLHFNAVYLKQLSLALKKVVEQGYTIDEAWEKFSFEDTTAILKSTVENLDKRALKNGWKYLLDTPEHEFSNDPILQETAAILRNIGLKTISAAVLREQITPRELSNEEVVNIFLKQQKELEESNYAEYAEPEQNGVELLDPVERRMFANEINQHLASLATARKFFESKDTNRPRSEAIAKRLKQVSIWMREMRTEMTPSDLDDGIPVDIKIEPVEIEVDFMHTEDE